MTDNIQPTQESLAEEQISFAELFERQSIIESDWQDFKGQVEHVLNQLAGQEAQLTQVKTIATMVDCGMITKDDAKYLCPPVVKEQIAAAKAAAANPAKSEQVWGPSKVLGREDLAQKPS